MTDKDKTKKLIEEVLRLMNVSIDEISTDEGEGKNLKFTIKTSDSAILIGTKGAHLLALNHVIKKMATRGNEEEDDSGRFFVDVNNYQEKLEEELRNKAKIMCERARSFKVDIELEPMSSYERMIVHSSLQDIPDIKTESRGEGKNRRVVIKYVEAKGEIL